MTGSGNVVDTVTFTNSNLTTQKGFIGQLFFKKTGSGSTTFDIPATATLQIDYPNNSPVSLSNNKYATAILLCDGNSYYLSFTGPYNP
jgi:hypothetical protein